MSFFDISGELLNSNNISKLDISNVILQTTPSTPDRIAQMQALTDDLITKISLETLLREIYDYNSGEKRYILPYVIRQLYTYLQHDELKVTVLNKIINLYSISTISTGTTKETYHDFLLDILKDEEEPGDTKSTFTSLEKEIFTTTKKLFLEDHGLDITSSTETSFKSSVATATGTTAPAFFNNMNSHAVASSLTPQTQLDLSNLNLTSQSTITDIDFTYYNLTSGDFANVDFSGCNFSYANLTNCDFTGATLTNCNVTATDFTTAILTNITTSYLTASNPPGYPANIPATHSYDENQLKIVVNSILYSNYVWPTHSSLTAGLKAQIVSDLKTNFATAILQSPIPADYNWGTIFSTYLAASLDFSSIEEHLRRVLCKICMDIIQNENTTNGAFSKESSFTMLNTKINIIDSYIQNNNIKVIEKPPAGYSINLQTSNNQSSEYNNIKNNLFSYFIPLDINDEITITVAQNTTVTIKKINTDQYKIISSEHFVVKKPLTYVYTETDSLMLSEFKLLFNYMLITKEENGGALGDPYIYPLNSKIPLKLPDKHAIYRLFEKDNSYINAEVSAATQEHRKRIINYARQFGINTQYLVTDGYFFSKFYINVKNEKIYIDLRKHSITTTKNADKVFNIEIKHKKFAKNRYKQLCMCAEIEWYDNGKTVIDVLFYKNPQIENGINIRCNNTKNAVGLLIKNYNPKLMELPNLRCMAYPELRNRLKKTKNKYINKPIFGKNEIEAEIRYKRLNNLSK